MYLIVGLGNPGGKYTFTRHNIGFLFADYLSRKEKISLSKNKFNTLFGKGRLGGEEIILAKPQTFMNLSGEGVRDLAAFFKIPIENILVVYDDVSLPVGSLRIRSSGSAGGHNGIKSIIYLLGQDTFPRIKIGVGAPDHPDFDLADWVLAPFSGDEQKQVYERIEDAAKAAELIVKGQTQEAMNRYNKTVKGEPAGDAD